MTSVLLVASDHVGSAMAAPGIRYLWFARQLSRQGHDVTLAVPFETDLREHGFDTVVENPWHAGRMTALARRHEVVVAQRLPVPTVLDLAGSRTRTVYDLCAPLTIEHAALLRHDERAQTSGFALDALTLRTMLRCGDAFVCAGERQRDLCLGALLAVGRITPESYRRDPSFRGLVAIVPFGIDPVPPAPGKRVLKGVVPGIGADDRIALWAGGIWNWLDPVTVIRAVHRLGRDDVRLFFLGTQSPNPAVPEMAMRARAESLARDLQLLGRSVFFNQGWVDYDRRGAYLLEADVGVSAAFDELETRYAFRTRLLDCLWASLPVVTTHGDEVGDLIAARGAGLAVRAEDVEEFAAALGSVLDAGRASFAPAANRLREEFSWPRVVQPLAELLAAPRATRPRTVAVAARVEHAGLRTRHAIATRGIAGVAGRAATGLVRRLRGDRAAHPPVAE